MEETVFSSITAANTSLPGDYLKLVSAYVDAPDISQRRLAQTTLDSLQYMRRAFQTGGPTHYAIVGNQIEI